MRFLFSTLLHFLRVFFTIFINIKHNPDLRYPLENLLARGGTTSTLRVSVYLIVCYNFVCFRVDKSDCEVNKVNFGLDTRMG
jgi:hypothetical protein